VPLLVRGRSGPGPLTSNFSYLDTRAEFGLITEMVCMRFLGSAPGALRPRLHPGRINVGHPSDHTSCTMLDLHARIDPAYRAGGEHTFSAFHLAPAHVAGQRRGYPRMDNA